MHRARAELARLAQRGVAQVRRQPDAAQPVRAQQDAPSAQADLR